MSSKARQSAARLFEENIQHSNEIHAEYLSDPELLEDYGRFTRWQLRYLLTYFSDMRTRTGYGEALNFVVSELAGVSVSKRDRQLARAAPAVTGLMPLGALETLAEAATLNAKTLDINLRICRNLRVDDGLPAKIDETAYFLACRRASNFDECMDLLELAIRLGEALAPTVRQRLVGITLKAMNLPAHAAGFGDLQEFFEKGYTTFRNIPDVDRFLQDVDERVTMVFERIYLSPMESGPP